ncbi:endonuclease [Psychrosphaera aestuarii]|uniref:endonuclease n=1 Tax=Psychrosphaera aestuarii TaxID=1266052 RepID=UPI001B3308F6|nr:endonuclease [Psychrosphaera aestuarii]
MFFKKFNNKSAFLAASLVVSSSAIADVPTGYYDSVNVSNASTLRASLHEIIDDHTRFPYSSSSTDTWDILEAADQDPSNANNVIDIYKNASYAKAGGGNTFYNREHSWPKSYGFPKDGSTNYAYTDAHHLFIADSSYNSSRSNKPYANCDLTCIEKTTLVNNGRGGASSESNWTAGSGNTGSWQTWAGRKGDVARALMYLAVRYEGGTHGVTGVSEPDLILTDDRTLIGNSNQGVNLNVAYMGLKSVLLQWHYDDPVDAYEQRHNDAVYSFQGNRNPFVDRPEYVKCVFEAICSGIGGGSGTGGTGGTTPAVSSVWINEFHYDNVSSDINEFVEVAGTAGTNLSGWQIVAYNGSNGTSYITKNLSGSIPNQASGFGTVSFAISGLQNGGPDGLALVNDRGELVQFLSYEGTFTATNGPAVGATSTDISVSETTSTPVGYSLQLTGTGSSYNDFTWSPVMADTSGNTNTNQSFIGTTQAQPWINEFHYDNGGTDRNEFIEVAGVAGTDLSGWKIEAVNGGNGQVYKTISLSGTIDNERNGFGALGFTASGLQNGPDGLVLINDAGEVVQFISYEGTIQASNGAAAGTSSDDTGVSENSGTASNYSVQLKGSGSQYSDFNWSSPSRASRGSLNSGQSF